MKKFFASFILALMLSANINAQQTTTFKHEVQAGETIYSISRKYNVSVESLLKVNNGLSADYVMAGQKINIPGNKPAQSSNAANSVQPVKTDKPVSTAAPVTTVKPANAVKPVTTVKPATTVSTANTSASQKNTVVSSVQQNNPCRATHIVKKKETIYSISRQYNLTEAELIAANPALTKSQLKKKQELCIPRPQSEILAEQAAKQAELDRIRKAEEEKKRKEEEAKNNINATIILPFALANSEMNAESQKMANIYQGFMLAVDSLRSRGLNVNVNVHDETSGRMDSILSLPSMRQSRIIIGPVRQQNIKAVADYAHTNNIIHVVPLSNEGSFIDEHPTTFQVNVPSSSLYDQVYNRFFALHSNDNIIFVPFDDKGDNPSYITGFKNYLREHNVTVSSVESNDASMIKEKLVADKRNIIIPSSASSAAFAALNKTMAKVVVPEGATVQYFGFPEWQTFAEKHKEDFAKYRVQFFTTFYSNSHASRIMAFNSRFYRWFKQNQYNSFPKFGELGYDIGAYFLGGIHNYGDEFLTKLHDVNYNSMEFPMNFERKNSWSGFKNNSLLIVTYSSSGNVTVR